MKYAIALGVVLLLAAVAAWAFLPARYLPGNRARHLRLRLRLRLHPGKGFATVFGLWLRWGRLAAVRRSSPDPPVPAAVGAGRLPGCALGVPGPCSVPSRPARSS